MMQKNVNTSYTDAEFRQLIREEMQAVLKNVISLPGVEADEGYFTVEQAADFLKLVKGTVYNLVNKNSIPYHKAGRRILFKKTELAQWLLVGPDVS